MASMSREGKGPADNPETIDKTFTDGDRDTEYYMNPDGSLGDKPIQIRTFSTAEEFKEYLEKQRKNSIKPKDWTSDDYEVLSNGLSDTNPIQDNIPLDVEFSKLIRGLPIEVVTIQFQDIDCQFNLLQPQEKKELSEDEYLLISLVNLENVYFSYRKYLEDGNIPQNELLSMIEFQVLELQNAMILFGTRNTLKVEEYNTIIVGENIALESLKKISEIKHLFEKHNLLSSYLIKRLDNICATVSELLKYLAPNGDQDGDTEF